MHIGSEVNLKLCYAELRCVLEYNIPRFKEVFLSHFALGVWGEGVGIRGWVLVQSLRD